MKTARLRLGKLSIFLLVLVTPAPGFAASFFSIQQFSGSVYIKRLGTPEVRLQSSDLPKILIAGDEIRTDRSSHATFEYQGTAVALGPLSEAHVEKVGKKLFLQFDRGYFTAENSGERTSAPLRLLHFQVDITPHTHWFVVTGDDDKDIQKLCAEPGYQAPQDPTGSPIGKRSNRLTWIGVESGSVTFHFAPDAKGRKRSQKLGVNDLLELHDGKLEFIPRKSVPGEISAVYKKLRGR